MLHRCLGISVVIVAVFLGLGLNSAEAQMRMGYSARNYYQQMYQQQYQQNMAMQKSMMEAQQKQDAADAAEAKRIHDKRVSATRSRVEKEKAQKEELIAKRKADNAAKNTAATAVKTLPTTTDKSDVADKPVATEKPATTKN